ncbi:hypothetical protein D3C85_14440 [compost metagenome]
MDLHKFNNLMLNCIGIVDETGRGHLSRKLTGDDTSPFTIHGKRVVLPTTENLRSPEDNTIVYHPLSENITRSESDVLKALRDTIMYQLTMRSVTLIDELGRVAATASEHKRLDAASQKYLRKLGDLDERAYEFLHKAIIRVGPEPEKRLISISLRKGKQADGVLRQASFKFPVLDSIINESPDLLGVKYPSKKARAVIRTLFEVVLGDGDVRASFDYGSKNLSAPYFDALMNAFFNMATHLNQVIETHRKLLGKAVDRDGNVLDRDMADDLLFDLSWYTGMSDLAEMRKLVPPQEGNEGAIIVATPKEPEKKPVTRELAGRLAPRDREPAPVRETRRDEPVETPPWEEEGGPAVRSAPPVIKRKTLDEALHDRGYDTRGSSRSRDYEPYNDRRDTGRDYGRYDDRHGRISDRYDRDDRYDRHHDRRDDRAPARRIDLGLSSDRDRDRFDDRRDDRRDDRGGPRRSFGEGVRSVSRY